VTADDFDTVLVVDFGAQYAQLIARRVREAHVYSEIVPHTITPDEVVARNPRGLIFSGGPASVHTDGAPSIDPGIYETGVPLLGICYGGQLLARDLGGEVAKTGRGEYGRTDLTVGDDGGLLFGHDLPRHQTVWMSHFDTITRPPDGFALTAFTPSTPAAAFESTDRGL
jgi:GMP synthase (glutamine-hydrolysing)